MSLQIQKGERGRWPKKKRQGDKVTRRQGDKAGARWARRKVVKKVATALGVLRAAGFIAWGEPREDE